jgi:hypothetical protein
MLEVVEKEIIHLKEDLDLEVQVEAVREEILDKLEQTDLEAAEVLAQIQVPLEVTEVMVSFL